MQHLALSNYHVTHEGPNLRLLAPLLQQWVTEVCTLIDPMPQDPERRMFELPYRCDLDDLDLDVVRSAIDPQVEPVWRIVAPSVKSFGVYNVNDREWHYRPAGVTVSEETRFTFDLMAGPGYGDYITSRGVIASEGMARFAANSFGATTHHDGSVLHLYQKNPLGWLLSGPQDPPREVTYYGQMDTHLGNGRVVQSHFEVVFKLNHVSQSRTPGLPSLHVPISRHLVPGRGRRNPFAGPSTR
ncbi:hypothetical protein JCM3766R1_001708 [Sporobolomyces carnicolor]